MTVLPQNRHVKIKSQNVQNTLYTKVIKLYIRHPVCSPLGTWPVGGRVPHVRNIVKTIFGFFYMRSVYRSLDKAVYKSVPSWTHTRPKSCRKPRHQHNAYIMLEHNDRYVKYRERCIVVNEASQPVHTCYKVCTHVRGWLNHAEESKHASS